MSLTLSMFLLLQGVDDPAGIVRAATHAIERDGVAPAVTRWQAVLARDASNVGALLGLATVARLAYDFPAAERHYATIAARAPRSSHAAWAALGVAESRLYRRHFDSVATWFDSAASFARAVGDGEALAQAYYGRALARPRAGGALQALAITDSGLRIAGQSDATLAHGRCVRSFVLWSLGDVRSGGDAGGGLVLARRAADRRGEAFCLTMLGQHNLTTGRHATARALFDTAVATAQSARDRINVATALWWRGHHQLELYAHDGARRDLSQALVESEASDNSFIASFAWLRLAVMSWHFGDMASARRQLDRGRSLSRVLADEWGLSYARFIDGAMALEAGDVDAAESAFRDELAWGERLNQPLERFTALFGLARVAMKRGDWKLARSQLADAEQIIRERGIAGYLPQLEYEHAMIALGARDLNGAERRFRAVLAIAGVSDLDRYAARSRLAEIHLARGDVVRAERELVGATDAIDSVRAALGARDLRVLAFQARKGYDDTDLGFATVIDGLARAGRVETALALAERRRARELRDLLARTDERLTRHPGATPVTAGSVSASMSDRLGGEHTAILEYVTGSGSQPTTLFVLTSTGATAVRRPPADSLASDVLAFAGMVEAGAPATALARSLGDAVFGTALDSLPSAVTRLVVVADGALQRLPFDALRTRDGRYVVERFAVSLAPSIAVAAELRQRTPAGSNVTRLLALGDPRFANEVAAPNASATDVYREAFSASGGLPRLRGSAAEARLVARFGDRSELRLRDRASERYLKSAPLDSFDVIHLATHALVDDRSMARTALAVAGGEGDDGFLGPNELSALKLDARLVVLSACRTARGVAVRGEGVQGLAAPLLAIGARSVLATQWRIRDRDAVHFIEDFYRALARRATVGDAARAAKLAAIKRGDPPATWAAFTVVGDPFVTVPLREPMEWSPWMVIVAGLGAVGVAYGAVTRTRRVADRSSLPSPSRAVTPQ